MDVHRVRRLATTLVASQLRSGRTSSNPRSWGGHPAAIALVDLALFALGAGAVSAVVRSSALTPTDFALAAATAAPLLPVVAVGATLIAGVLFELTAVARFSGSDAANWLPLTPAEYVASSALAVAYTYSPAVALFLGVLMPLAFLGGLVGLFVLTVVLSAAALFEGAVLVEMVRATTQRAGASPSGRRGQLGILLRAALLVVLILAFDLAFNPVLLLPAIEQFSSHELLTALVPVFWSTEALALWSHDELGLASAFAIGQVLFVGLLVALAARLRARYWSPLPSEPRATVPTVPDGHPMLESLGLSAAEAAIASKDLRGFVRRREMLPTLVVPVVLIVLMLVEGRIFGPLGSALWAGWVAGFFGLLLAATSVGQERRAFASLYAYPITPRAVLRGKAASVLLPTLIGAVAAGATVGVLFRYPLLAFLGLLLFVVGGAILLTFWGFVFAARFSDFQERPRPQYLRPMAMLAALGSGMMILFAVLLPSSLALLVPGSAPSFVLAITGGALVGVTGLFLHWARTGFDRLLRELPF